MKNYGDICLINGCKVEAVDCIIGGSPCQNLSVAGNRKGLEGSESRLFLEQMRVVKEMRQATGFQKPRYMVWENVCFRKGSLVTLKEGFKSIEHVCKGDFVKTHTGEYRQVLETFETEAQPLMWVNLHSNHKVFCTQNHPFLTLSESSSDVEWKPASSLTVNDFIAYKLDGFGTKSIGISEAWAVGRWLADGSLSDRHSKGHGNGSRGGQRYRLFFSCGYDKRDVLKEHLEQMDFSVRENAMKHAINFTITSDAFYELISTCGRGAAHKRLPDYTFSLVKEEQEALLEGYLSGDGHYRDGGEITFCSVSKQLAYGIARLVRNVYHVPCSLSHRDPAKNPTVCGRAVTSLPSFAGSFRKTYHTPSKRFIYKDDSDTLFVRVRGVGRTELCETVYNLSVDDDNSYEVEGVSVHNCGALSCNKGKDFQCVLNECVETALLGKINLDKGTKDGEKNLTEEDRDGRETGIPDVPMPKDGKWPKSGILYDDMGRWSIAWRVHDAQYWGVAQRRRRLALVCDFGGMSAPEVLFESQSVSGDFNTCDSQGKETSRASDECITEPDKVWDARGNGDGNLCSTLTGDHDNRITDYTNVVVQKEETYSINGDSHESCVSVVSEVSRALKTTTKESVFVEQGSDDVSSGQSYPCICIGNGQAHDAISPSVELSKTLNCLNDPMKTFIPSVEGSVKPEEPWLLEGNQNHATVTNTGVSTTFPASMGLGVGYVPMVTEREHSPIVIDRAAFNQGENAMFDTHIKEEETMPTLVSRGPHAVCCPSNREVEVYSVTENGSRDVRLSKTVQSYPCICIGNGQAHVTEHYTEEVSQTLNCMHDPMTILEPFAYQLVGVNSNSMKSSNPNSGCYETEQAGTITTNGCVPNNQGGTAILEPVNTSKVYCICSYSSNCMKSSNPHSGVYEADTSRTLDTVSCGNPVCCQGGMAVVEPVIPFEGNGCRDSHKGDGWSTEPVSYTLNTVERHGVAYGETELSDPHAVAHPVQYHVRRLTPLECTRLQGYPDGWVDIGDWIDSKGKKHKEADAPKYKALGNSIALPFWKWLCRNIVNELQNYGYTPTMASLFDGIGGFSLCWTSATHSKESVLWVSEIEEFPLAVTRHHFH